MSNSVQMKVAEQISAIAPKVEDKVVGTLVDRELVKRSDALVNVMDKLDKANKDFKRLVADVKTYDEKGTVLTETFSKARIDERAKAQKQIDKMTGAINKALEKGDFGDVYNLASGKPANDDAQPAAEAA